MYRQITECRICGGEGLDVLLELGTQFLTGVFPRRPDESLTKGPLTLVRCDSCGLVQLLHSYEKTELYGQHYGYRSSLNRRMVSHLESKAGALMRAVDLRPDDVVVDIGSNDGTLLSFFSGRKLTLIGVDPSAARWQSAYPADSRLIADFFTADVYRAALGRRKARIVTSIAMFYDLERPLDFAYQVADILADDGVWHLEQSYLPEMLRVNAYDTICHEHVEYYALAQIKWLADKINLAILDVECNDVNGGSFAVTLGRNRRLAPRRGDRVDRFLGEERRLGFDSLRPFEEFRSRVLTHKRTLRERLEDIRARGESVLGYGASTKGNVILQFAGIDRELLPAIAEVNDDKFGCVTPGTWIPIISEADARARKPDRFMVLPWHFRAGIVEREAAYLAAGGKLMFPLPAIEIVTASDR
jgi:C-methyltransferase C-terminal domain/Putative zinc binding domain/Methyltransferase domain